MLTKLRASAIDEVTIKTESKSMQSRFYKQLKTNICREIKILFCFFFCLWKLTRSRRKVNHVLFLLTCRLQLKLKSTAKIQMNSTNVRHGSDPIWIRLAKIAVASLRQFTITLLSVVQFLAHCEDKTLIDFLIDSSQGHASQSLVILFCGVLIFCRSTNELDQTVCGMRWLVHERNFKSFKRISIFKIQLQSISKLYIRKA